MKIFTDPEVVNTMGSAWTERQKKVAMWFAFIVIFIAVTAAFMGFSGHKSVNVIAFILGLSALGIVISVVAFFGGMFSKKPVWTKAKKVGWMFAVAPLIYIAFELLNPIL